MNTCTQKPITITKHARQRLLERIQSLNNYRSWEQLVKAARYNGQTLCTMSESDYQWCISHLRGFTNSHQIRILDGFVFIFAGNNHHARTLITVIKVGADKYGLKI